MDCPWNLLPSRWRPFSATPSTTKDHAYQPRPSTPTLCLISYAFKMATLSRSLRSTGGIRYTRAAQTAGLSAQKVLLLLFIVIVVFCFSCRSERQRVSSNAPVRLQARPIHS